MPRIRSIKPEAFTSETLAALPVLVRWTFAGLWTYADDDGRAKANIGLIKAAVWPLDDDVTTAHIGRFLDQLEAAGLICRYEVDGKAYLHVVNFSEHQHPNRPVPSKLPACSRRTHGGLSAGSVGPHPSGPGGSSEAVQRDDRRNGTSRAALEAGNAGQDTFTEHAVSPHGALNPNSSTMPPTPLRNEQGEGDGEGDGVQQASPAAANESRREPLSITQRSKIITDAYALAEPLCKWPAVNGVVIKAIKAERFTDDEIRAALLRMAAENRSVTVDSLRTELGGLPSRGAQVVVDRRQAATDQKFDRAMERARARDAQEGRQ